jgi:SPP1 family predicted phage head-tail adaptor
MDIGDMQHLMVLQKQVVTKTNTGHKQVDYQDVEELWASIEPTQGEEIIEGDKLTSFIPHEIKTRYNRSINSTCRFRFDDEDVTRYFNVLSTYSPKEERVFSISKCREDTSVNA